VPFLMSPQLSNKLLAHHVNDFDSVRRTDVGKRKPIGSSFRFFSAGPACSERAVSVPVTGDAFNDCSGEIDWTTALNTLQLLEHAAPAKA
jgi:hypothetical protein